MPFTSLSSPYQERLSQRYVTGLNAVIHDKPYLKSSTSVLSLASEDDIDVSAQYRSVILLLPKQTMLLPVVIFPEGEADLPASLPSNKC